MPAEREAVVAFLRTVACNAMLGNDKAPTFAVKTDAKAKHVVSFTAAALAEAIERGDHLKDIRNEA